jgi:putative peptidoglycan lipid II flippase
VPSSKPAFLDTSIYLFRVQLVSVLFIVLSNLLGSIFQAQHFFFVQAIFPIISSLVTLAFVFFFGRVMGISSLVYGTLTGAVFSFIFMMINVLKKFRYRWSISILQPGLKSILLASLPLFSAGILYRSTTVFERFFAARLPEGSLSYLGTGNQIIVILSTIVSGGIATTSFPLLSRYWSENDLPLLEKTFSNVISLIILIIFPLIIIFVVNGLDIIHLLFEHGVFTPKDSRALYLTLLAMMGFFLFGSIGNVVARMFYLTQNTRALALIAILELFIYLTCALMLVGTYHFVGLALSLSLSAAFNIALSILFIKKKIIDLNVGKFISRTGKIFLLSLIVFLLVFLVNKYFLVGLGSFFRSVLTALLVATLYWFMISKIIKGNLYHSIIGVIKR